LIEDPPLITLRPVTRRASPAQVAALSTVPTSVVVDAMGGAGALAAPVKAVVPAQARFCGTALPCWAGPADNLAVFAAVRVAEPGDVIVCGADGFAGAAVSGDLLLGMARNKGVVAFVTDGCVRDVAGIRSVGLPCFATGIIPNSPARNGPGTVGFGITLAGRLVEPGDIVLGDEDGVAVVPFADIAATIAAVAKVRAAEAAMEARVNAGLAVPDFIEALFSTGKVRLTGV
jgi:4-hydroxy-4-methyl-2-oxoglutarate aldolase